MVSDQNLPPVLVTGATGFVGSAVCRAVDSRATVRMAVRNPASASFPEGADVVEGSLYPEHDWARAVDGISAVVHCAARVHVMRDRARDPLSEFRRINVDGTLSLARQAAAAGVRRFIYLSSVKVHGESTAPGIPFTAADPPRPVDPYGISKLEAELALRTLSRQSGMEVVIIRPPLVYGPGVKANMLAMMRWIWRGVPLPLGSVESNRRSLVALDNLVDLIVRCLVHPAAANQTLLVADGEDLSTAELLRRMGRALGRPARLLPVPASLLQFASGLVGKRYIAQRLCGSLQVDISRTRSLLDWSPPVCVDSALEKTARYFIDHHPT